MPFCVPGLNAMGILFLVFFGLFVCVSFFLFVHLSFDNFVAFYVQLSHFVWSTLSGKMKIVDLLTLSFICAFN